MNIPLFISRFLYRIRYQLLFGSLAVTLLVAYFTQFLPKTYTVDTTIYTGIVSSSALDDEHAGNYQIINNSFDNLINLLRSQATLENVALHLFAMNMIHGDPDENNMYITAKNFNRLRKIVPDEIKSLIDKTSEEKTVENLKKYLEPTSSNFLYALLNGDHPHYSFDALRKVQSKRLGNSDMIEISYQSDDPGITTNTVKLFNSELVKNYNDLRYKATDDVIAYFEAEVEKKQRSLKTLEDSLTRYNVHHNIINYEEQTKALAIAKSEYEDRYEAAQKEYQSSSKLLESLEKHLDTRSKLYLANTDFLKTLEEIASINGKITELETFTAPEALKNDTTLAYYQQEMRKAEQKLDGITTEINLHKYSKDGIAIDELVSEWLKALLQNTKAKAELKVLNERKQEFQERYTEFSPVGTELKRREREINVTENSYLELLHALNLAYLKKKNIQLTTAGLNTITPPLFPLSPNRGKRFLLTLAALLGSLIFITGYDLLIELIDRTLRDPERTKRLTGIDVEGAFAGRGQLRNRGYSKAWNRMAADYVCHKLNRYLQPGKTIFINLLSIERGEGKSFVGRYMAEEWEKMGLRVTYLKAGTDFQTDPAYIRATEFGELCPVCSSGSDIVLIEYPAVQYHCLPAVLIEKATVNVLIANSRRVWKNSDDKLLAHLQELSGNTPLVIYLNNAGRETVEDFTGPLPPYSSQHSLATQMMHMGFTAKGTAVSNK